MLVSSRPKIDQCNSAQESLFILNQWSESDAADQEILTPGMIRHRNRWPVDQFNNSFRIYLDMRLGGTHQARRHAHRDPIHHVKGRNHPSSSVTRLLKTDGS